MIQSCSRERSVEKWSLQLSCGTRSCRSVYVSSGEPQRLATWTANNSRPGCRAVATGVGVVYLLRAAFRALSFLCPFVKAFALAPLGIFRADLKKYGPWAGKYFFIRHFTQTFFFSVVTGASEGIGRAYAFEVCGGMGVWV